MIDYLIMLLSTDWFRPYWSLIGAVVDVSVADSIREGCREIVRTMIGNVDSYYAVDFSEERTHKTQFAFISLLERLGTKHTMSETIEEWATVSHDELRAVWIYTILTRDLFSGDVGDGRPDLGFAIREAVMKTQEKYDQEPTDFLDICMESRSKWDAYTRNLTTDQPTVVADYLAAVLRHRRLKELWSRVQQELTPKQREELVAWYHAMARFRGHRDDLIPAYLS